MKAFKKYWFGTLCAIVAIASIPLALHLGFPLVKFSFVCFICALVAFVILANVTHNYENFLCTLQLLFCVLSFVVFAVSFVVVCIRGFIHLIF